ncbi:SLC13 family permease, partial [Clavibacter michiganensis subsp. insidiosus]|uniref:SLC13 family permease n=1 Tax=Clavibacter michiganensis TaxID=28447 RepID=UPI00361C98B6
MRTALIGAVLLVVGAVAVATGALPLDDLGVLYERVWPILLFVVAITVVTELASEAGLFTWIAERAAGLGRGRTWALWLATVVLACLCTIFLSLDTTRRAAHAVVVVLARHCGLPPLPFALTTVWLANTASLLLPVSNLTNLLARSTSSAASARPGRGAHGRARARRHRGARARDPRDPP